MGTVPNLLRFFVKMCFYCHSPKINAACWAYSLGLNKLDRVSNFHFIFDFLITLIKIYLSLMPNILVALSEYFRWKKLHIRLSSKREHENFMTKWIQNFHLTQ